MTLVEELSRLHRELPGCRSVLFGDMGAGIVLRACADADLRQEDHDALLETAAGWLGPEGQRLLDLALGAPGNGPVAEAILLEGGETCVFRRCGGASCDVICAQSGEEAVSSKLSEALQQFVQPDG